MPEHDESRHWYDRCNDVYDAENCLVNTKIEAEHRYKLIQFKGVASIPEAFLDSHSQGDLAKRETYLPSRNVVEPLRNELATPFHKFKHTDKVEP